MTTTHVNIESTDHETVLIMILSDPVRTVTLPNGETIPCDGFTLWRGSSGWHVDTDGTPLGLRQKRDNAITYALGTVGLRLDDPDVHVTTDAWW